jgi:Flp pilus assembly pilin Flp
VRRALRRFIADATGQDLVEYALVAVFVALASVAGIRLVQATLKTTYTGWNTRMQNCWEMPAPGAGGGC